MFGISKSGVGLVMDLFHDSRRPNKVLSSRPSLVCVDDGEVRIELVKDITVVGRDSDCDVQLEDKGVSKIHCVFFRKENSVLVRDLHSTNGTKVNGKRVRRATLVVGDVIALAGITFKLKVGYAMDENIAINEDQLPDQYPDSKVLGQESTRRTRMPETGKLTNPMLPKKKETIIDFEEDDAGVGSGNISGFEGGEP